MNSRSKAHAYPSAPSAAVSREWTLGGKALALLMQRAGVTDVSVPIDAIKEPHDNLYFFEFKLIGAVADQLHCDPPVTVAEVLEHAMPEGAGLIIQHGADQVTLTLTVPDSTTVAMQ